MGDRRLEVVLNQDIEYQTIITRKHNSLSTPPLDKYEAVFESVLAVHLYADSQVGDDALTLRISHEESLDSRGNCRIGSSNE